MTTREARKVRLYPCREKDGDGEGYVTACTLVCAREHAEVIDHVLFDDAADRAEDEDDRGQCDRCGYPNPADMSDEVKRDLTPAERDYILDGGGDPYPVEAETRD